jgi:hypothetical protein
MNYPKVLVPAYGRTYKTAQDAVNSYLAGKDFKMLHTGQYCSCRDFSGDSVSIQIAAGRYQIVKTP